MCGVVPVQLGLLEGQQVILFLQYDDAAFERLGELDLGDQDAVEGFDQEGARGSRA